MISIVTSGSEYHILSLPHCEVVRNWDWFVVSDQKSILRTKSRTPRFDLNIHARFGHIDRTFASLTVLMTICRHPFLMSSPSKLRWLVIAFRNESIHRPSVPEFSLRSSWRSHLSISLGYVNSLDSKVHHKSGPLSLGLWNYFNRVSSVLGQVDQSLLDKPTDHSWVCTATGDCSWLQVLFSDFFQKGFSKSIVASFSEIDLFVGVEPFPLFFDCVDIEDSLTLAV